MRRESMKTTRGKVANLAVAALALVLLATAACQMGEEVESVPGISPLPTSAEPLAETAPVASPTSKELAEHELRSTTPPAPQDLQATFSQEGTRLEWKPVPEVGREHSYSDTILYYHVYHRAEGEMEPTLLDRVKETSYLDRTAKPGMTYHYAVSAVHEGPVEGELSEEVTPTGELTYEELPGMTPPTPEELRVELAEEGAHVAWKPGPPVETEHSYSDVILRYDVYRRVESEGELVLVDSVIDTQYLDTSAEAGVVYCYSVSAVYDGPVEGELTDEVCLPGGLTYEEMRSTNPPPPQNLQTACGDGRVRLAWEAAPTSEIPHGYGEEILYYNLYRRTEGTYDLLLLTRVEGTSYVDPAVEKGVVYYYAVSAVHEGPVEGQRTDEVSVSCP
jgi:fibronectin type 3 domain-containing protein